MTTYTWSFETGLEDWSLRDESAPDNGSFSAITWDSADEAIEQEAFIPAIAGSLSRGWILSPVLTIPVDDGDTIEMDVSALSPGGSPATTRRVRAVFTDTTQQDTTAVGSGATTVTLTLSSGAKTLDHIELVAVEIGNGGVPVSFDIFCDLLEVRLTVAATPSADGLRTLGMDVDLADGNGIWITYQDVSSEILKLRKYSSSLSILGTANFGSATEAQVDARTYYISPYNPPFFDNTALGEIVYIYGRWNDGTTRHLTVTTNAGTSYTDIGDSATWGSGWVGGFFADDANTLYAFVNGGSRALYRSIDGGSNWSNLGSLPFDVDPGGVSKHPDGRILISNRDSDSATAAYAEGPNYSSWIDATGSPSFPSASPGNGSNAIIWIT